MAASALRMLPFLFKCDLYYLSDSSILRPIILLKES